MVYSTRRFVLCLTLYHFVLVFFFCFFLFFFFCFFFCFVLFFVVVFFFSPFSIAITSLGEERANLSAFHTFLRFVLVWICRFPFPLGVWEGLRFVIVALPGLFSYLFSPAWQGHARTTLFVRLSVHLSVYSSVC